MEATQQCFGLITDWESFYANPYQDPNGVWTNGYGHTRTVTANTPTVTKEQALNMLKVDVQIAEAYVNSKFKNLRQCQFDAVVSLIFNIKIEKFNRTTLFSLLQNEPDSKYISGEWVEFRNAGGVYLRGLLRRRLDELRLYYSW